MLKCVKAGMTCCAFVFGVMSQAWSAQDSRPLMGLLEAHKYLELQLALKGPVELKAAERAFFEGVLDAKKNRPDASRRRLEPYLAEPSSLTAEQKEIGLLVLADDYQRSFQFAKAADTYSAILKIPALDEKTRTDAADSLNAISAGRGLPAQTVDGVAAFTISTKRNVLGLREADVTVNSETKPWILDSGAGLTTLSASYARSLGLHLTKGTVPVNGFAGTLARAHLAVIPLLRFGEAEIHNSPVIVLEDAALYIPELKLQIDAILGAPVLTAMGRLTFHADGLLDCAGASTPGEGAELFQEDLLSVAVGTPAGPRLFILDTGGNNTVLLSPYWLENHAALGEPALTPVPVVGVGGQNTIPAASLADFKIEIANVGVTLKNVTLYSQARWKSGEYFFGNISQDVLSQFKSYTIDYRTMRFSVEK